jgi:hypothetical protein
MMNRAFAILASACLILAIGCTDYETRLAKTLEDMKYKRRLDTNLLPPATKGKLEELQIFVRPPMNLKGPTQTFAWTVIEPGRFDLENSFIDQEKQESLHMLVRVKKPKGPASNKKGAVAKEEVPRGDFPADVIELVKSVYGVELERAKFKPDVKEHDNKKNAFSATTLDLAAKEVQIFLYGDKNAPREVALIFDYPKESKKTIDVKIRLCLEAFAVGEAARHAFNAGDEGEGGEEGSGEPGPI